eukprot:Tbor_TRINITY_DN5907_c0_g4::TRINITY_DN5907_c0_g4_i1::g.19418::m.19418
MSGTTTPDQENTFCHSLAAATEHGEQFGDMVLQRLAAEITPLEPTEIRDLYQGEEVKNSGSIDNGEDCNSKKRDLLSPVVLHECKEAGLGLEIEDMGAEIRRLREMEAGMKDR